MNLRYNVKAIEEIDANELQLNSILFYFLYLYTQSTRALKSKCFVRFNSVLYFDVTKCYK